MHDILHIERFSREFGGGNGFMMRSQKQVLRFAARLAPVILLLFCSLPAFAGDAKPTVNAGDTAWLLCSTAMVMLMTAPGLALFYGGLVSHRNILTTLMHSFFMLCLISIQWVLWGYSLSFGTDVHGWIGGLNYVLFQGVGTEPISNGSIPQLAFAMYQSMFAVITVALITGAFAERIRFKAFVAFSILWATFIYDPLAHWVWGGGWLMKLGTLDFAGGTVVHISSGVSALVAAIVIGRRSGYPEKTKPPHNLTLSLIGASLLWFGWFGFNAGSALSSGGLAAMAFATTNTAAASAAICWALIEAMHRGKPTVLGVITGSVAGLVAITPASGYVSIGSALAIGMGASLLCYWGVNALKPRFGYDDALDVFGVHGIGGTWGAIATGIFASKAVNPAGADGFLFGNPGQLWSQIIGAAACWLLASAGTFVILKVVSVFTPLRVSEQEEEMGIDLAYHGEFGYHFIHHEIDKMAEIPKSKSPFAPIPMMSEGKVSAD
jgi:Amt family ammonium transporter